MAYEAVNVAGNPAAQAELEKLGIPRVPATVLADGRHVHGWNPQALADLLGVDYTYVPTLSAEELAQSLDRILAFAQYGLADAPDDAMAMEKGGRKRSLRELGYHVLRLGEAFVEGMEQRQYPLDFITDYGPEDIRTGPQLARYGAEVRERLRAWFATAPTEVYAETVETYYGPQTGHELLERTTWHCGQHLRQVYDMLADAGAQPPGALDDSLFEGLPMPEQLW